MPLRQPRRAGILLKTGQTTQYSGEEDDGYHEKGLTKRYAVLTTGQHSGACEFDLNGKTETQSHNCVRDLVTGLMWARFTSAESASVGPGSNGLMAWHETDDDIFDYCAAANVAELGGYSDWRIPNCFELVSLITSEAPNAAPDAAFLRWPTAKPVFSSTTQPDLTSWAEVVKFDGGHMFAQVKTALYFAALVRGGV